MDGTILLGVRLVPNQFTSVKVENVNLDSKVESFKEEAATKINAKKESFGNTSTNPANVCLFDKASFSELVYCGMILENDCTLLSYGIKPGVTIHVLEKKVETPAVQAPSLSWAEVQQLVAAFRAFMLSPGCRAALQVSTH